MMWHIGEWWHAGAGYGFHWVLMIAFWGIILFAASSLIRAAIGAPGPAGQRNRPKGILKERYAAGGITHDQYETMVENIRRS